MRIAKNGGKPKNGSVNQSTKDGRNGQPKKHPCSEKTEVPCV